MVANRDRYTEHRVELARSRRPLACDRRRPAGRLPQIEKRDPGTGWRECASAGRHSDDGLVAPMAHRDAGGDRGVGPHSAGARERIGGVHVVSVRRAAGQAISDAPHRRRSRPASDQARGARRARFSDRAGLAHCGARSMISARCRRQRGRSAAVSPADIATRSWTMIRASCWTNGRRPRTPTSSRAVASRRAFAHGCRTLADGPVPADPGDDLSVLVEIADLDREARRFAAAFERYPDSLAGPQYTDRAARRLCRLGVRVRADLRAARHRVSASRCRRCASASCRC